MLSLSVLSDTEILKMDLNEEKAREMVAMKNRRNFDQSDENMHSSSSIAALTNVEKEEVANRLV